MKVFDSCLWIAFYNENDSLHEASLSWFENLCGDEILLPFEVYAEVLTVLRMRSGEEACKQFVSFLEYFEISISFITQEYFEMTGKMFFSHPKLSMVDALLLALHNNNYSVITFNKALQKAFSL